MDRVVDFVFKYGTPENLMSGDDSKLKSGKDIPSLKINERMIDIPDFYEKDIVSESYLTDLAKESMDDAKSFKKLYNELLGQRELLENSRAKYGLTITECLLSKVSKSIQEVNDPKILKKAIETTFS